MSDEQIIRLGNVKVTSAGLKWKAPKAGENYSQASAALEVENLSRELEDRIGFYGASGKLIDVTLSPSSLTKIIVPKCGVMVSSTIKAEEDQDPRRVTKISLGWDDEHGELFEVGSNCLGFLVDAELRFLQHGLPLVDKAGEFAAQMEDSPEPSA